ncbi:MAG TPA: YbhB/YbcL family Raf kinase inhibitor-like protein [Acidimicrobiales bacterium]|jgi:hypothetical protein
MNRRVGAYFVGFVCACALLAACASDGRTLRAPAPGASAPPPPTAATTGADQVAGPAGSGTGSATAFTLTSPAFASGAAIPVVHTCDGQGVSPPLAWGSVPVGTVELAITVIDPDANGFVHWVIGGIDPSVQAIAAGSVPDGAVQAMNGASTIGWTGPCPPKGPPHHYVFTLYAFTTATGLTNGEADPAALTTIQQTQAVVATLTGTYQRAG